MSGIERLERALRRSDGPSLVAYVTGGFPTPESFPDVLRRACEVADAVEIGIPFTDPMADGVTIQRSSAKALAQGFTLRGLLEDLVTLTPQLEAPILLMSYLNPLLAVGAELPELAARAGVTGFIIPDLPHDEASGIRAALEAVGIALVQLVTPVTTPERLAEIGSVTRGFVYAVTVTGITGGDAREAVDLPTYLTSVRDAARAPVLAGFGIRTAEHVGALAPHADGVIVGSALIEAIEGGVDAGDFLRSLRP